MLADPPFLTLPEAAAKLGVGESTVRRWVKAGRLKAIHLPSGRRRVRAAEVEAILASDELAAGAA
jgi:excisionase family DNA binding protein